MKNINIKLGIEKTIVGSFYLFGIYIFLILALKSVKICSLQNELKKTIEPDYLPYISIIIIALSYILGTIADKVLYFFLLFSLKILKKFKLFNRLTALGEKNNLAKYVEFLQKASDELIREYTTLTGQSIIFRVLAFAVLFLGGSMIFWFYRINETGYIIITIIGTIVIFSIFIITYILHRREFQRFRAEAYREFSANKTNEPGDESRKLPPVVKPKVKKKKGTDPERNKKN